jgi:3-deoxy-7-phosphoheptulonate synthase
VGAVFAVQTLATVDLIDFLPLKRRGKRVERRSTWKGENAPPAQAKDEFMLVVMKAHATEEQVRGVCEKIEKLGYRAHAMPGAQRTAIGITGNKGEVEQGTLEEMEGVQEVIKVSKPYKLVSRDIKEDNTVIRFAGTQATIGGTGLAIVAGPCAIESREQAFAVAERVHRAGAQFFRGGAYKPRTSPYSFQGLGEEGLRIMAEIRQQYGMKIITEAIDNESLDLVEEYADMIQIGARNMQNFSLLKRAGRAKKPVLLKRGMSATLEEFLMAAEYILSEGNYNVALCERGVRTFADHTRNTLDLSLVPAVQRLSHLPIFVDPSHGTGKRNKVTPLSRAAVAVGADGLMVEVHNKPDEAMSDGPQSLFPDQFDELMTQVRQIAAVVGRTVPGIGVRETGAVSK